MKKYILVLIVLLFFISNKTEAYHIPREAIRMRVVANSNSDYDQKVKFKVSNQLQATMYDLLKDEKGIKSARTTINNNMDIVKHDIDLILKEENYPYGYKVNFGYNHFPEKKYNGVTYKEGDYESLLVTLGNGDGNNWWCVLFPPLCVVEADKSDKVEYKSFVKELFKKYL